MQSYEKKSKPLLFGYSFFEMWLIFIIFAPEFKLRLYLWNYIL